LGIFITITIASPRAAYCAPSPGGAGWIVGASTFGGATIGATGGFFGSAALGSMGCSDRPHGCGLAPLAYGVVGAGLGAAITTPLTAHFTSKAVGANPKRVLRDVGITAGASAGVLAIGTAFGWGGAQALSVAGFAIGIPIAAGFSTAQSIRDRQSGIAWTLSPQLNRRTKGFTISARF